MPAPSWAHCSFRPMSLLLWVSLTRVFVFAKTQMVIEWFSWAQHANMVADDVAKMQTTLHVILNLMSACSAALLLLLNFPFTQPPCHTSSAVISLTCCSQLSLIIKPVYEQLHSIHPLPHCRRSMPDSPALFLGSISWLRLCLPLTTSPYPS